MKINYMVDDGAFAPVKGHTADAGFDLRVPTFTPPYELIIRAHDCVTIDTGVHFEIPEGYVGFLKSKSGLNVKAGINGEGVIDSGYTGSVVVKLYNHSFRDYTLQVGDKAIQIVFLPIPDVELAEVKSFKETERGDGGFGSTGR